MAKRTFKKKKVVKSAEEVENKVLDPVQEEEAASDTDIQKEDTKEEAKEEMVEDTAEAKEEPADPDQSKEETRPDETEIATETTTPEDKTKPGDAETEQTLDDLEDKKTEDIEIDDESAEEVFEAGKNLEKKEEEVKEEPQVKGEKKASFLDDLKEKEKGKSREFHWGILAVLGIILITVTAGYFAIIFGVIPNPFPQKEQQKLPVQTETPIPTPIEEATDSASVSKEELTLEILNGTGIPGQAALIRTQLSKLGYQKFTLDNLDRDDTATTELNYTSRVSKDQRNEISAELKKIFKNVDTEEVASEEAKFDISIVTGDTLAQ
jgi:hypothetical protein